MRSCTALISLILLATGLSVAQDTSGWTQLSLSTCGVDRFLADHPEANGHGVVIAVLDTGVDPSIPGLTHTPDGAVKVIDVQDFTGDGDVSLERIRLDAEKGKIIHQEDGDPIEYEPPELPARDAQREREFWWGELNEKKFVNSDQPDLNDNGTTDDVFPVLVTALQGEANDYAVCYVDTDMDRSFADEQPLKNYRLEYDTFTFQREQPEEQIRPMTFAVNIFLRQEKVVFHFDNGAHGTHVAGIAAGYQINNQADFHGVAPGAKLMSLKIGMGAVGSISVTESKKQALRYAAAYAREHAVPVVCNLSYGVESEIEGASDIDEFVNDILVENPYLVFCTSAGNSGAGLSTVGTPAAAREAISVAAMMAADTARDVAGWDMDDTVITTFSSRGGELDKPDIATPGWSTSTVPRFVRGRDFWAGTSMASPYAAGLCANLISYAIQQDPGTKVRAWDVRRALCLSARPLEGFTVHDYGYGVPDLPKAAELLDKLLKTAGDDALLNYNISTYSPTGYENRSPAAFWRTAWSPVGERQSFSISPVFMPTTDMRTHTEFARKFALRSLSPWCKLEQESVYLRSEQSASVHVDYEGDQLTEPGMHVGVVEGLHDGLTAFRLINTVIVPYEFTAEGNYTREWKNQTAEGWIPQRWFVAVPPGASSMKLTLSAPEGMESHARIGELFNPHGHAIGYVGSLNTDGDVTEVEHLVNTEQLTPGVWEIPVYSNRADKSWPYDLKVQFYGLQAHPAEITTGGTSRPSGDLVVTNMYGQRLLANADGAIEGLRMHKADKFEGLKDELTYSVNLDGRFNRLRLKLSLEPQHYAETTDIGVMVKDPSGDAIYSSAFAWRELEAILSTRGHSSLTVVITAGFALADFERETPIDVKIDQLFASPVSLDVSHDGDSSINFYPGAAVPIEYQSSSSIDDIPDGYGVVGYLRFRARADNDEVLRVPLEIGG